MKRYFLLWLMFLGLYAARGQQGAPDPTFSGDGSAKIHFLTKGNTGYETARKVLVQPDGKYIVLIIDGNHLLARYNTDGTLDQSFGSAGYAPIDFYAFTAAIGPDGKIVVGGHRFDANLGTFDLSVARFHPNGTPDAGFGVNGVAATSFDPYFDAYATALAVQSDGKIVAVGNGYYYDGQPHWAWIAARYTSTGVLDASFNAEGLRPGTAVFGFAGFNETRSIALQSDGKIVVGGTTYDPNTYRDAFTLVRLLNDGTSDGTPDPSFGTNGWVTSAFSGGAYLTSMALQADGKIVAAGYAHLNDGSGNSTADLVLTRYLNDGTSDGTLDATFGAGGLVTTNLGSYEYAYALDLGPESIVVAGEMQTNDGTSVWYSDQLLACYNTSDGALDATFNPGGSVPGTLLSDLADNNLARSVALLSGGGILVAGEVYNSSAGNLDYLLARYTSTGSLDPAFNPTGTPAGLLMGYFVESSWSQIMALVVQSDGKVVAAGRGDKYDPIIGDYPVIGIARFNTDGTLDGSFGTGGINYFDISQGTPNIYPTARSVALAPDGKIVVGGELETYDEGTGEVDYDFILARFTGAGVPDETFGGGDGLVKSDWTLSDHLSAVAVQSDGKILAVGASFDMSGSSPDFFVTRYTADGVLDNTFDNDGIVSTNFFGYGDYAVDVAIQSDGRIVVSGGVENKDANNIYSFTFGVVRYTSSGVLDNHFGTGGKATAGAVNASAGGVLALQSDGKILVGGIYENKETADDDLAVMRFTSRGILDGTFGTSGIASMTFGVQESYHGLIALQNDGKILQAAWYEAYDPVSSQWRNHLGLARYTSTGVLDNTFDGDGKITNLLSPDTYLSDIAWNNGRLYTGGHIYPPSEECAGYLAAFVAGEAVQPLPVVTIEDAEVTEGGTAAVTVRVNTTDHPDLTLNYATLDGTASSKGKTPDYKAARASITIPNGSDVGTISITTYNDADVASETLTVSLSVKGRTAELMTISDGSATVTILAQTSPPAVNKAITVGELPEGGLAARAFPNPTSGHFTLQLQSGDNAPVVLKVTDMLGRLVEARSGVAANSTLQLGNNYRPGVYYVHLQQGTQKQTLKLVKEAQ